MQHDEHLRTLVYLEPGKDQDKYLRVNQKMLEEGMDFETATQEITGRRGSAPQMRTYARTEIIEENRTNFAQVLADTLLPYRRVVEGMNATYEDGKPNWKVRLDHVKLYCQLMGHDPRQGLTVNVGPQGDVNIHINQVYALARYITNEEDRISFYNEVMQGERRGMFNVTPGSLDNPTTLPIGNNDFPPVEE
jgi:hypothetical protein